MTLSILADATWYGTLALIVLGATWTLGRQFWSEQRELRRGLPHDLKYLKRWTGYTAQAQAYETITRRGQE